MKRLVVLFLCCLLIQPVMFAQQPTPKRVSGGFVSPTRKPAEIPSASGKWWKNSSVVRTLELSEAQIAQLEAVYLQHQARLASLRFDLLQQEEQLKALLVADRVDERGAAAQMQLVANARLSLEMENGDMTLGMRRVLTADQWRKLEKLWSAQTITPAQLPENANSAAPLPKRVVPARVIYNLKMTKGITEPLPAYQPKPAYTQEARDAKIEGTVVLEAVIGADGMVSDFKVLKALGYGLDESAIDTIGRYWRFSPALLNGQPVNVRASIEVSFRLY